MSARIRKVLASTKFGTAPFVVLSAAPGGGGKMGAAAPLLPAATGGGTSGSSAGGSKVQSETVADLVRVLKENISLPVRSREGPFHFAIDHCFPIKGQGTVLTGTVLCGSAKVNDMLELPEIGQTKKIKSIQMFHKPAGSVSQGDRAGLCVAGLDASLIERGIGCTPGSGMLACIHLVSCRWARVTCCAASCDVFPLLPLPLQFPRCPPSLRW